MPSITATLTVTLGGTWKYNQRLHAQWDCNDKRYVRRCVACTCDDHCSHPSVWYLYENGKSPTRLAMTSAKELLRLTPGRS